MEKLSLKEYLEEAEKLLPNISPLERRMLRYRRKKGLTPKEAVEDMINFNYDDQD